MTKKIEIPKGYCERIHLTDFFMGIGWFFLELFIIYPVIILVIIIGMVPVSVYNAYLIMLGEPVEKYNLLDDWFTDKKLRYKKWKKEKLH